MLNHEAIESLTKRITNLIPDSAKPVQEDIESSIRSVLQATLSRMQLVTREEFDVQSRVLERTREKLDKLETQLASMQKGSD